MLVLSVWTVCFCWMFRTAIVMRLIIHSSWVIWPFFNFYSQGPLHGDMMAFRKPYLITKLLASHCSQYNFFYLISKDGDIVLYDLLVLYSIYQNVGRQTGLFFPSLPLT